ncbi:MAG: hypothetical protein WCF18_03790 [Chthoniobacteraceae bacterium]
MRAVKLSLSLLALCGVALSLCACNTVANRRSLYSPKKGDGYWTRSLHEGTWKERGLQPVDVTVKKGGSRAAAPVPPPPAPTAEPLPEPAVSTPPPAL